MVEDEVWDGAIGHLKNGDYARYIGELFVGVSGQEKVIEWLEELQRSPDLSWYKKDKLFTEFAAALAAELEKAQTAGQTSSSPARKSDENTWKKKLEESLIVFELYEFYEYEQTNNLGKLENLAFFYDLSNAEVSQP